MQRQAGQAASINEGHGGAEDCGGRVEYVYAAAAKTGKAGLWPIILLISRKDLVDLYSTPSSGPILPSCS